jgi:hypothetical protein
MTVLPQNLDYTDKDYDSIYTRLTLLTSSVFPDWSNDTVANFGNILKGLMSYVGDILSFYMDNQAAESRLTDARIRQNVLALAKMLGFDVPGASAATATVTLTLAAIPVNDVVISAGQLVRTKDVTNPVSFQILADVTIPGLSDPPQAMVDVENSTNYDEAFSSNTLADQSFLLAGVPYLDGSVIVTAANGAYTEVVNLLDSSAIDRDFYVTVDQNDRARVVFGDGVNGQIPAGTIVARYRVGGGVAGNVGANTIAVIPGTFTDILGNSAQVTVNNPLKASGGSDRMSVAEIKEQAPAALRVSDRVVSLEDYVIEAEQVPGVARALMLTADQAPGVPENRGFLYVVPDGGGYPTQTLKDAVYNAVSVTKQHTITFRLSVEDPLYKVVNIDATVFRKYGSTSNTVGGAIRTSLTKYFALTNSDGTKNTRIGFGFSELTANGDPSLEIPLLGTIITDIILSSTGVLKIGELPHHFMLNGEHSDLQLALFEFPTLGTVTLTDGDTGLPM